MLTLHATQALADKIGGFTAPSPADTQDDAFSVWFANVIRRRKPQVIVLNPLTLVTFVIPLAPARTLVKRIPEAVELLLNERAIPDAFVEDQVGRLREGVQVVPTNDRRTLGIMNGHVRWFGYFNVQDDEDWWALGAQATESPVVSVEEPVFGHDRLAAAVDRWKHTGRVEVPAGSTARGLKLFRT